MSGAVRSPRGFCTGEGRAQIRALGRTAEGGSSEAEGAVMGGTEVVGWLQAGPPRAGSRGLAREEPSADAG